MDRCFELFQSEHKLHQQPKMLPMPQTDNRLDREIMRIGAKGGISVGLCLILASVFQYTALAAENTEIDATDPTKIYSFIGGGIKYTDYTNGETMQEARVTGNWGISQADSMLFEFGYGWHDGDLVPGDNSGLTNARVRYFHIGEIKYDLQRGYRGMGYQVDMQFAGQLKGTDGQNVLLAGVMPVFAISNHWDLYLTLGLAATWDKKFAAHNGTGLGISPQFIYAPEGLWSGAQLQITPEYKYFLTKELQHEGSGNIDINVGGMVSGSVAWDITWQKNFDIDLNTFRRGEDSGINNDWNVFFNVTSFF
jgi:hypothetical protein